MLTKEEKKELLKIARESIKYYFKHNVLCSPETRFEKLKKPSGAFVTLKIDNNLRGCVGLLEAEEPLSKVIAEMSLAAAFDDQRFSPLNPEEFKKTSIEISVLTPFKKITNPSEEIKIGKHGVILKSKAGFCLGVFLPQVAVENNWDLKKFMDELCEHKAGLAKDSWRKGDIDIYV